MISLGFARNSLKFRLTIFTLTIFVISIWSLTLYISRMLRADMERLLGEQQFSSASFIAADINDELKARQKALGAFAAKLSPAMLDNAALLQELLDQRLILPSLFGGGVIAYRLDGTAIADTLPAAERIGINYMDTDTVTIALKEGKPNIGRPVAGKKLGLPVFGMTVPIRDAQGKVIGALAGVIDLSKHNFLDKITDHRYGNTGGYVLVARQSRVVVTATDKSRIMEPLPAIGTHVWVDRFTQGYEGSAVSPNPHGVEMLVSGKAVPIAGWFLLVVLPTTEAFAPIQDMKQRLLLATLVVTLLAGALTWWTLRRQLAPMVDTANALAKLAHSNSLRQPLPITRQDEIGELIGGFNRLLETVSERDVTLQLRDKILSTILETSLDGFWRVDAQGRLTEVNSTYCQQSGYDHDELLSMHISDLEALESSAETEAHIRHIIETGHDQFESKHRRKDGSIWDVEVSATYGDATGGQFYVFLRDVTERKLAADELKRSLDLLSETEHIGKVGGWSFNVDTMLQTWTDEVYRIHELEPPHKPTVDEGVNFYAEVSRPIIAKAVRRAIEYGEGFDLELELITAKGNARLVQAIGKADLKNRRIYGFFQDITERKRAEIELLAAKSLAEAANLSKSRFLAAASHDLRQPMHAINLFAHSLARTDLSEDQKPLSRYLTTTSQALGDLLNAILDLSKFDAELVKPDLAPLQVDALLAAIEERFAPLAAEKSLRFKLHFPFGDMAVSADSQLLLRLLGNLVGNAIKCTERGGILVAIRRRGNQALIQVWDTGIGIAPEHQDRIFEEYFQVGNPERDSTKGLGLGLAISNRITKLLDTEVVCRSRLGKGSVFEFRLPLATGEENSPSNRSEQPELTPLVEPAPCHVVLLEDNLMVGVATKTALESRGMRVTHYKTAEEALADAGIAAADFYIADLWLPGMDGAEFLDEVQRKTTKPIKAVILTGDKEANPNVRLQGASRPVLFKPVDLNILLSTIKSLGSDD